MVPKYNTSASEISVQLKNSKTSVLCWAPSNTPTFEGDTLKLSICSKVLIELSTIFSCYQKHKYLAYSHCSAGDGCEVS